MFGESVTGLYDRVVWGNDVYSRRGVSAALLRLVRIIDNVIRDLANGQLSLRAMGLVYTTLLSVVPFVAVSFSVLTAFQAHEHIQPMLESVLTPLGDGGKEVAARIIGYVDNVEIGKLGAVGLLFLLYTVISTVQKIEQSFNYTWRVVRARSFTRRFRDYLSVMLIGPVLIFGALGLMATAMNSDFIKDLMTVEPFGMVIRIGVRLLPYLLILSAFAFVYAFVPNTTVRLSSAFVGAAVAGGLWEMTGMLFARLVVTSTQSAAIYSGLAILVFFMLWLFLAWLILLIGASIAFYFQNPESLSRCRGEIRMSARYEERLVLNLLALISSTFRNGSEPWTRESLARRFSVPLSAVDSVVGVLVSQGYLTATGSLQRSVLPARPLDSVPVADVLVALRGSGDAGQFDPGSLVDDPGVRAVSKAVDDGIRDWVGARTIADLDSNRIELGPAAPRTHASTMPDGT